MALDAATEIKKIKFAKNSSGDLGISVPSTINGGTINLSLLRSDDFQKCRNEAKDAIKFSTTTAGEIKFKIPNNLDDSYNNEIDIRSERVDDDPDVHGLALVEHGSDSPSFHSTVLNPSSDDKNYSETDTINISSSNGDFKFTTLTGRTDGGRDLDYQDYLKNGSTQYWDDRDPPKITNSGQVIQFFDDDGSGVNAKITITGKDIKIIEEASVTKLVVQKKGTGEKTIDNISDGTAKTTSFSIDGTQKTFHKITWEGHDTNNATIDDDGSATRRVLFVDNCNSVDGGADEDCVLSITSITGVTLVPSDTTPPPPVPPPDEPTVSLSASPQDILKDTTSTITFDFSESVNFFIQDVKVSNGTLSNFSPAAGNFTTSTTATLTPDTNYLGFVNVTVPAESFTSEANGVLNSTAYTIAIKVTEQPPAPSVTITPNPNRLEGAGDTSTISINLSQTSPNFISSDVYLSPNIGTLRDFTAISGDRYTVIYEPTVAQETDVNVKVDSGSFTNNDGLAGSGASAIIYVSNTPAPVTVYNGDSSCAKYGSWNPSSYNPNAACADAPDIDDGGDKDLILKKTGNNTIELDLKNFQGKLVTVDVSWSKDATWDNDFSFEVAKCSDIKEGGSPLSFTPYTSQTISKNNPIGPLNWRIYNIDGGSKVKFTSTSTPPAAPTRPIYELQVSGPVVTTDDDGLVTTTYTGSCVQIGTDTASPWPPCAEEVYVTKTGYNEVEYVYSDGNFDGANDQFITITLKATRSVLPSNREISMDLGLQRHIWLASTTADDGNGEPGHSLYDYHYHSDLVRFRNPSTGSSKTDLKTGGTQFSELVGYAGAKTPSEVDAAISSASGGIADLSS